VFIRPTIQASYGRPCSLTISNEVRPRLRGQVYRFQYVEAERLTASTTQALGPSSMSAATVQGQNVPAYAGSARASKNPVRLWPGEFTCVNNRSYRVRAAIIGKAPPPGYSSEGRRNTASAGRCLQTNHAHEMGLAFDYMGMLSRGQKRPAKGFPGMGQSWPLSRLFVFLVFGAASSMSAWSPWLPGRRCFLEQSRRGWSGPSSRFWLAGARCAGPVVLAGFLPPRTWFRGERLYNNPDWF